MPASHAVPVATHTLLELWGVPFEVLDDPTALEAALRFAAEAARCEVLGAVSHRFEPQGASVVLLVAESHLSIHTWPELGYAAADILTCGHTLPQAGVAALVARLAPTRREVRTIPRGVRPSQDG